MFIIVDNRSTPTFGMSFVVHPLTVRRSLNQTTFRTYITGCQFEAERCRCCLQTLKMFASQPTSHCCIQASTAYKTVLIVDTRVTIPFQGQRIYRVLDYTTLQSDSFLEVYPPRRQPRAIQLEQSLCHSAYSALLPLSTKPACFV